MEGKAKTNTKVVVNFVHRPSYLVIPCLHHICHVHRQSDFKCTLHRRMWCLFVEFSSWPFMCLLETTHAIQYNSKSIRPHGVSTKPPRFSRHIWHIKIKLKWKQAKSYSLRTYGLISFFVRKFDTLFIAFGIFDGKTKHCLNVTFILYIHKMHDGHCKFSKILFRLWLLNEGFHHYFTLCCRQHCAVSGWGVMLAKVNSTNIYKTAIHRHSLLKIRFCFETEFNFIFSIGIST